ncbi:hypothetical protein [Cellulomonas sp. Leaf334]|uniref:hypothetical protein n=1 Tax=Cellulomonas sp. Leaf334 TaxID=1736339 RepID=UPI0006F86D0A|nr:hypothetical protein [Cellulomonas sp. Leaf334]KQR16893.1 hypothetical protein ASF78_06050 [Cellulomonas sp. Leaf334]
MSTDKTPRDADETLALPVTDQGPATDASTSDDDTTVIAADDTAVLSADADADPAAPSVDDTAVLPADPAASPVEDTAVLPAAEPEPAVEETRALPTTDEADPYPSTSAWSSQGEPAAYTSPIGALYAPTDRPADRVAPDPVAEPAPVVEQAPTDPPRRRLRVGTVVWGLVIAAIGVGLLAWAAGFAIDLQLAMIVLLAVAGTALLVGSIVSGARAARR